MNTQPFLKPRVCYLRGSYLNPYEMQYLDSLKDRFSITVAHTRSHRFEVGSILFPRQSLACLDYCNGFLPRTFAGFGIPNPLKFAGYEEVILGLGRIMGEFDLVHVPEQTFVFTWQVIRRMRRFRCKVIVTQAEVRPYWYRNRPWMVRRTQEVRNEASLFLARSLRARQALICEGVKPERVEVIGHGVDIDRFAPGPRNESYCQQFGIDPSRFIVLFVGRIVWTKGLWALADAVAAFHGDNDICRINPLFVIAGDGPERRSFENYVREIGVQQSFKLIGHRPYSELDRIHRMADIFVLPSISTRKVLEQFGIALIEAMATGKPVISTHCGAIDEVVGDAGILVQPNDALRLYQALKRLILDTELRNSLGKRARQRVIDHFSHEIIANKLARAYEGVLQQCA